MRQARGKSSRAWSTALVIMLLIEGVVAMPAPRNPLLKKGAKAWENAKHRNGHDFPDGINRLLVHAVDDSTNLVYQKAVRRLLGEVRRHGLPFSNYIERDATMARHLEQLCYVDEKGLDEGSNCFFRLPPHLRGP